MEGYLFNICILSAVAFGLGVFSSNLPEHHVSAKIRAFSFLQLVFIFTVVAFSGFVLRLEGHDYLSILLLNSGTQIAVYSLLKAQQLKMGLVLSGSVRWWVLSHILLLPICQFCIFVIWRNYPVHDLIWSLNHLLLLAMGIWVIINRWRNHCKEQVEKAFLFTHFAVAFAVFVWMPLHLHSDGVDLDLAVDLFTLVLLALISLGYSVVARDYFGSLITQLRQDAITDSLTGLRNRRYLFGSMDARESESTVSLSNWVILIDIDNFKQINDEFGHAIGDLALQSVANTLKCECREPDMVVRFGGEEFLVVLNNVDMKVAETISERLRAKVENNQDLVTHIHAPVTISLGVSRLPHPSLIDKAIQKADAAMYLAKEKGKNCVQIDRESFCDKGDAGIALN